jgi:hypothetical protein
VEDPLISDEDLQKELAMFTNTQFYDFDSGQNTDYQRPPPKPDTVDSIEPSSAATEDGAAPDTFMSDFSSLDFIPGQSSSLRQVLHVDDWYCHEITCGTCVFWHNCSDSSMRWLL